VSSSCRTGIANEALGPREVRVCALGTGEAHFDALLSQLPHTGTPVDSAAPIAPEQRGRTHPLRMQQHTHLARLARFVSLPLTLLAQWTGVAVANAGRVHQAQAAVSFPTLLLDPQRLPGRAAERSVGLERKVGSGEAARFPGGSGSGRPISSGGRR
jgi:hypothetical protein